jgi:ribosomal protein L23
MIRLRPRLSEKSYASASKSQTYVFDVDSVYNSQQIAEAVAEQYKVSVVKVNSFNKKGKVKRSMRRRAQPVKGREKTIKHAYVTLKAGDKIPVFEEVS